MVNAALVYDELPEQVKEYYRKGLVTYKVVIELGQNMERKALLDFVENAAILRKSQAEIKEERKAIHSHQKTLIDKKELAEMKKEGQRKELLVNMRNYFYGVTDSVSSFTEKDKRVFIDDYYLMHRFQLFFRNLEELSRKA